MFSVGTHTIRGEDFMTKILDYALSAGYRLFGKICVINFMSCLTCTFLDTAAMYGNEKELGVALKELLPKHNLSRKDVFITTKLCKY